MRPHRVVEMHHVESRFVLVRVSRVESALLHRYGGNECSFVVVSSSVRMACIVL